MLAAGALALGLIGGTAAAASAAASGALQTKGAQIVTAAGTPYTIKAVSWFGMETSDCAPHGLWSITLEQGLKQIAGWGFNTIRLPFSNECLGKTSTTSINATLNPALAPLSPLKLMDAVIARAKANGLNVILDRHRPDSAGQSELWYTSAYPEKKWIDDWKMLALRYKSEPTVIGVDLHNEPRGAACWGCGDAARDWQAAATRGGNAVLSVNPNLLIIVEGIERESDGSTTWWGGGLRGVKTKPVALSVANRVVYSPHDYPASVSGQAWFTAANYPANLESVWEQNWGYISTSKIAPVLLGEFGTKLTTTSDKQWLQSLVGYLGKKSMSFAYWSFNPNSGDTGGLVMDDWKTPQQAKLTALAPLLGKTPTASPTPTATPKPTASATPKPTASATPKPTSSATPKPTASATPKPTASATPKPTASATPTATATPKPTATPTPRTTTPAPPASPAPGNAAGVVATFAVQSAWAEGYVADIAVTAASGASSWSVSWPSPGATAITSSWGMTCAIASSVVTCTGADWGAAIQAGQTQRVGIQVAAPTAPSAPALTVTSSTVR
ncbi:endoglucanase [Microbacterium pygmaeum]|uniref:Endoglucanase n=2 Tax=Microbacterium pygmaeum TaxID=370764 RepID=A0A1G8DVW0_9MICO|nr:endoglucanase [Microbacterium pygmaeum]